jgi:hypothetical protein
LALQAQSLLAVDSAITKRYAEVPTTSPERGEKTKEDSANEMSESLAPDIN